MGEHLGLVLVVALPVAAALLLLGLGTTSWVQMRRRLERGAISRLPNRHVFERRLDGLLARPARAPRVVMVLLDLDGLKGVDAQVGRRAADRLVRATVQVWRSRIAGAGNLYDLERGRFALLLETDSYSEALHVVESLRTDLPYPGTVSAGIGAHRPGDTLALITTRAGASLHRAKLAGKDCVDPAAWNRLQAEDVERGLDAGEFFVVFQPVVALADGRPLGCEALLRWAHPRRGLVLPSEFVPAAEEAGLVDRLDDLALTQALAALAGSRAAAEHGVRVAVNVAGADLEAPGYAQRVRSLLADAGVPPDRLVLEVTESTVGADRLAAVETLHDLHSDGVLIAIDDFGTGYSSLARIRNLPIDILKVDRQFVVDARPSGEALLAAVVALGHGLGIGLLAEGVETAEQADRVRRAGCGMVQGRFFGGPDGWQQFEALLTTSVSAAGRAWECA